MVDERCLGRVRVAKEFKPDCEFPSSSSPKQCVNAIEIEHRVLTKTATECNLGSESMNDANQDS